MHINFIQNLIDKIRGKNGNLIFIDNEKARANFVEQQLKQIPKGLKILDAGAGFQRYKKYCEHLKYESQDFCQYDGKGDGTAFHNGEWNVDNIDIVSDITSIPRDNETYDAILCTEVLEHIINPMDAIKEFSRLLKINGKLILTAPFCSLTHQSPYYFYNGYSIYWYKEVLSKYGFEIKVAEENGNYFDYFIQEINRFKTCQNKYCVKNIKYPKKEIKKILNYLKQCSDNQHNSEEFLCFGWHIVAIKKG